MARSELSFKTLDSLHNGEEAIEEFNRLILASVKDCRDRKHVEKKRAVMLKLSFEPDGDEVLVAIETKHTLPPTDAGMTRGSVDRSGKLIFNPAATDNPNQSTLDDA